MTIYLITGAGRGLGRALAEALLAQPSNTVVAGVRDIKSPNTLSLQDVSRAETTKLIVVKIDAISETDARDAARELSSTCGINNVDVVIANGGYGTVYGDLSTVKPMEVKELVDVNGIGPLRLFQAFRNLLENSALGKFVLIGSPIASISGMEKAPWPMVAYGASKAVAHYLTRKIHNESRSLTAFVIDPGFMQTDMGNTGAKHFGYEQAFIPVAESCKFTLGQIEVATRESVGGKFMSIDGGKELEW